MEAMSATGPRVPICRGERRWTVAVWEGTPSRLDRVTNPGNQDSLVLFELVDEEMPSTAVERGAAVEVNPIWIELSRRGDFSRKLRPGEWWLTEEWFQILDQRRLGGHPIALRERMLGLQKVAFPGKRLRDAFRLDDPELTEAGCRWIFANRKGDQSWVFLPLGVDAELREQAKLVDPSSFVGEEKLRKNLEELLHRPVRTVQLEYPRKVLYALELSKGSGTEVLLYHSAYQPRWEMRTHERRLKSGNLSALVEEAVRNGFLVPDEEWEEWEKENVYEPKLLLDLEQIELFAMLGEDLPLLWDDQRFVAWASEAG